MQNLNKSSLDAIPSGISEAIPGTAPSAELRHAQRAHWERQLSARPHMFGAGASNPAHHMNTLLKNMREHCAMGGMPELLELGAGQGRDTVHFAAAGWRVLALDYAEAGVRAVQAAALAANAGQRVRVLQHDVRQPLPLEAHSVDACYAHMLLCMALTMDELRALCAEVRRVLRPGGLFMYTVRHEGDPHYGVGLHGGENMYETDGFMVHFFNKAMVETLAGGFNLQEIHNFEEGTLPRKLWRITMRKNV